MNLQNFSSAVPVIATADVLATVRYFEQTLGFKQQWLWGDPPIYAGVRAGSALLYITHDPVLAFTIKERRLSPDIFLWVTTSMPSILSTSPPMPRLPKN